MSAPEGEGRALGRREAAPTPGRRLAALPSRAAGVRRGSGRRGRNTLELVNRPRRRCVEGEAPPQRVSLGKGRGGEKGARMEGSERGWRPLRLHL